jgi:hypothetical protein
MTFLVWWQRGMWTFCIVDRGVRTWWVRMSAGRHRMHVGTPGYWVELLVWRWKIDAIVPALRDVWRYWPQSLPLTIRPDQDRNARAGAR